jgi:hypothetical protein
MDCCFRRITRKEFAEAVNLAQEAGLRTRRFGSAEAILPMPATSGGDFPGY